MRKIKRVFLNPGQGAQTAGMGQDLYDNNNIYKQTFDMCEEAAGLDLKAVCFEGRGLGSGETVQPAIFAHSISLFKVLQDAGREADIYAGLSLGEYSALAAADVLGIDQCAALVRKRGALMDNAFPKGKGGMLSVIGFTIEEVEDAIKGYDNAIKGYDNAYVANHLSELSTVISGTVDVLAKLKELFEQKGAKMVSMLDVAGPFHSPFLNDAAKEFEDLLGKERLGKTNKVVYSNVLGKPYGGEDVRELLAEQMRSRVRWHDCVEDMAASGAQSFVEVGPGKVLSKMVKRRVDKSVEVVSVRDLPTLEKYLAK